MFKNQSRILIPFAIIPFFFENLKKVLIVFRDVAVQLPSPVRAVDAFHEYKFHAGTAQFEGFQNSQDQPGAHLLVLRRLPPALHPALLLL